MSSLSQRIKVFLEHFEKESEKELKKKLLGLLNEDSGISEEDFEKLISNQYYHCEKVPDLELFKSLSESQLESLLQKDNSYSNYSIQLVHRACKQNKSTELVTYLIEKGFKYSIMDTIQIISNGNLELIKYYAKNINFKEPWNVYYGLIEAIKMDREDIFNFLLENKLDELGNETKKHTLEGAVDMCFQKSSIKMLKILLNTFPSMIIPYVRSLYDEKVCWTFTFKPTPSNRFLLWLWDNNMKWTKEQSEKLKIPFMCSFYGQ